MDKEDFITERTRIISEMIDNPDNYGIYPTSKCFKQLDELFDKIVKNNVDLGIVMPRYFVDIRGGCGAVRDRKHEDYDKDYQGLHFDTSDVVLYKHGFQNHAANCWDMSQEDVMELNNKCDELNEE